MHKRNVEEKTYLQNSFHGITTDYLNCPQKWIIKLSTEKWDMDSLFV
jgi:hypothetical protein